MLNYIKCLATDISATDSTYNWVSGVASSGTYVKDSSLKSNTFSSNIKAVINNSKVEWQMNNNEVNT